MLAAALGIRALVPAGVMPERMLSLSVTLCGEGMGGEQRTIHIPVESKGDKRCAWEALAAPALSPDTSSMLPPMSVPSSPQLAADGTSQDDRVPARLRPPAQGPPAAA